MNLQNFFYKVFRTLIFSLEVFVFLVFGLSIAVINITRISIFLHSLCKKYVKQTSKLEPMS